MRTKKGPRLITWTWKNLLKKSLNFSSNLIPVYTIFRFFRPALVRFNAPPFNFLWVLYRPPKTHNKRVVGCYVPL